MRNEIIINDLIKHILENFNFSFVDRKGRGDGKDEHETQFNIKMNGHNVDIAARYMPSLHETWFAAAINPINRPKNHEPFNGMEGKASQGYKLYRDGTGRTNKLKKVKCDMHIKCCVNHLHNNKIDCLEQYCKNGFNW